MGRSDLIAVSTPAMSQLSGDTFKPLFPTDVDNVCPFHRSIWINILVYLFKC